VLVLPGEYENNVFGSLGRLEAEELPIAGQHHCVPSEQPMGRYSWGRRRWSNDRQLFCACSRPGAYVELEVSTPATAVYELDVCFTRAPDFGIVRVSLDGKNVHRVFDGYDHEVVPAGKLSLGKVDLRLGPHRLRFTVIGQNKDARGYHMGIDYLELRPVK
jgi:hypothetical protein